MIVTDYQDYKINFIKERISKYSLKSPVEILVVGATGVGKSTTLNSLLKKEITTVGYGCEPETMDFKSCKLNDYINFWDSPGLGDSPEKDKIYIQKIKNLLQAKVNDLYMIDLCLVIVEPKRDIETTVKLIEELMNENMKHQRIIAAINQADFALKGHHWKQSTNSPDEVLKERLKDLSSSIQRRIKENTGIDIIRPVCYSAYYNWNLTTLYKKLIQHIPKENRKI